MTPIEKRLKARETNVETGGHTYTLRRPTAAQMARLSDASRLDMVRECVVSWSLKHIDIYPGGDPVPCEFDAVLWSDYLDDHPEIWTPLADAILAAIAAHQQGIEAAAKN